MKSSVLITCLLIVASCETASPPASQQATQPGVVRFNTTFKAAAFTETDRVQKVVALGAEIEALLQQTAKDNHYPGMVYGIVMEGKLVWSSSYGIVNTDNKVPVSNKSLFKIASMSKSFTAMAIMKLVEMGKLKLNDEAATYMPEMKNLVYLTKDATPITIENLLTMTAGFPEDNPWGDRQLEDTPEELQALVAEGLSFSNIPSFGYEYSNTGFAILGQIISNVSGQPYQEFINENIFKPLGMNNTYWEFDGLPEDLLALGYRWEDEQWKPEPLLHDGAFGCMGGLITSLDDFSKYVAYHLSAYPPNNDDEYGPVKRSSLRNMHKPKEPSLMANARDADGNTCPMISGYGYGLSARKDCNGVVYIRHSGGLPGFGSDYRFYPEYDLGIISFANRTYAGAGSINNEVANLIFKKADLQPRILPPSDILLAAQTKVARWLQTNEAGIEEALFAENFFLDFSRDRRIKEYSQALAPIGNVTKVGEMKAINQLRGVFTLTGENGSAEVFFTMSPEKTPKVQQLDVRAKE